MTYCVAIIVNDGLVFCSDSRTNAGPDMLSSYSKMHIFRPLADRQFCVLTAGNLATTQAIIGRIEMDLENNEQENLSSFSRINDVANYVAKVNKSVQMAAQASVAATGVDTSASLLFGGFIAGSKPAIFHLYSVGNFISASVDTPFLQIGESKYGKPILDRILKSTIPLEDAARCALVSMDSTIKSNATVGPPIEILILQGATSNESYYAKLKEDDPYLIDLRTSWDKKLKESFTALPAFDWQTKNNAI